MAYHSHIDPSVGATALNQQAQLGGEGDLHKIIANTYALPFKRDFLVSLLEKTRLRGINTTAPHLESNPKIMKYYADRNAAGQVEDKTLQQVVKNITGLTLVRLKVPTVVDAMPIPPEREIWVARVPADSGAHAYYLRIVVAAMGPTGTFWKSALADHWLARPLSTLTTPVKEQSYTSDSLRDIESCAYAGLNDISIEQPDELERKVRRAIDAESKSAERPGDVTVVKQTRDTHRSGKGIASKSLVFGPVRPPHLVHEEKQNIAA